MTSPRESPPPGGVPVAGTVLLVLTTVLAFLGACWLGLMALLLSEPPSCLMQLTEVAQAHCEYDKNQGYDRTPAYLSAGMAVLTLLWPAAAWWWRRRRLMRWCALPVLLVILTLGVVLPDLI